MLSYKDYYPILLVGRDSQEVMVARSFAGNVYVEPRIRDLLPLKIQPTGPRGGAHPLYVLFPGRQTPQHQKKVMGISLPNKQLFSHEEVTLLQK
ncbi:hypothetical protein NPIL_218031 [Nephila pilipes]|uniref:Uncharacterized protein n=1 Tax=Nephila pilipes TaxID=299642 RepID=A0A8X6TTC3_NEPPI|nr:hypothetical protein NPIL_218031 [Nephila pilipes]